MGVFVVALVGGSATLSGLPLGPATVAGYVLLGLFTTYATIRGAMAM